MRTVRRMTRAQFESVRPLLRISPERIEAAGQVLVDGVPMQAAAAAHGWKSRNTVHEAVNAVWAAYDKLAAAQSVGTNGGALLPPGWEQVTFVAPKALIKRWRSELAAAVPGEVAMPVSDAGSSKLR